MMTSGFAPFPQIPEGLYTIEEDNTIRLPIKNSSTGTLSLLQNRPIPGILAHDLEMGYHDPVEITKQTLRAFRNDKGATQYVEYNPNWTLGIVSKDEINDMLTLHRST